MKLKRRQLKRLIEASVKKDGEFVTPIEEPLRDPLEDLYYNTKQKQNIKMLAMSDDEEGRASSAEFAELGGFIPTDRFGADDFPKQVVAYELGIDILNDFKELDTVIKDACMNWMYHNKDEITVYDVIQIQPYEDYVKEVVEEPQDIDNIMLLTIQIITDEIDHLSQQDEPNGQLIERFKKAKKLFESNHEAARSHVYDILTLHPDMLYKLYFDTNSEIESIGADFEDPRKKYAGSYPPHGATDKERYDMRMTTYKEGKLRLTRKQLRKLITEAIINEMPLIKPGGDLDPEHLEQIETMIATGDEANIGSADLLAYSLGYDGEEFSQDKKRYDDETFGTADNYYALTKEDKEQLARAVANQNLFLSWDSYAGIGFRNEDEDYVITEGLMLELAKKITPERSDEKTYYEDIDDQTFRSMLSLAVLIMRLANTTTVNFIDLEDLGLLGTDRYGKKYIFNYDHPIFGGIGYSLEGLLSDGKMIIAKFP